MRTCPRCGLLSPDQSLYCQCGFDLASDVRIELARERVGWRASAKTMLWTGIFAATAGAVLTGVTYLAAVEQGGGTFIIFTGMMVVGVTLIWRGYTRLSDIADIEAGDGQSPKPPG